VRAASRIPVLVGVGVASQREPAGEGLDVIGLIEHAVRLAAADAGAPEVLAQIDWIGMPEGTWALRDPGHLLAARIAPLAAGDPHAVSTVVADVGILQQDLLNAAISAVLRGARVALVAGGETKFRALQATIAGLELDDAIEPEGAAPDVRIKPDALGVSDLEIVRDTVSPVTAYALIENALGHARGRTPTEHGQAVAALWARFAAVAADNPHAWDRAGHDETAIADGGAPGNRMIAEPYTKRHSAQWNVDQAAALLLCSLETARTLGIAEDRLVFPLAATVANQAVPVSERRDLHRSIGAEIAAPALLELAGVPIDAVAHLDLYSCFPSAVEILGAALGLDVDTEKRPLTITGGLAFAGGPLNNYVLQALVALAERLRADPGSIGLSSSVSGFLAKQGFSLWSTTPPARGFKSVDVSDQVTKAQDLVTVVDEAGAGTIATWTVDHRAPAPRSVAIVDRADGTRTIGVSHDRAVAAALTAGDPIGTPVAVSADGELTLDEI
jgi:acetyl-CoA C-acetyltransferase